MFEDCGGLYARCLVKVTLRGTGDGRYDDWVIVGVEALGKADGKIELHVGVDSSSAERGEVLDYIQGKPERR